MQIPHSVTSVTEVKIQLSGPTTANAGMFYGINYVLISNLQLIKRPR